MNPKYENAYAYTGTFMLTDVNNVDGMRIAENPHLCALA